MTTEQIIYISCAAAVVVVVIALRKSGFTLGLSRKGLKLDNKPPADSPGILIDGATSRKGSLHAEDNTGRGVKAKGVEVEKDINIRSAPPPKQ